MDEISDREKNIKRMVELWRQGAGLHDLDEMSREDLRQAGSVGLADYKRHNYQSQHGVYGAVTLDELRIVKNICEAIRLPYRQ